LGNATRTPLAPSPNAKLALSNSTITSPMRSDFDSTKSMVCVRLPLSPALSVKLWNRSTRAFSFVPRALGCRRIHSLKIVHEKGQSFGPHL
jgi:hypothetical protein